jgi:hypothetical protein
MFTGLILATGLAGTPLIRFLKDALWGEEDMTGRFSSDNTAWRNASVLWEQSQLLLAHHRIDHDPAL